MIHFTDYGVIAEKPRVSHLPRIFRAPCRKKLCFGSKNDCKIFNGLDVLYHHAKFGEIELRTPAVGAKMWCLYAF